jgi:hypothetical protein
MAHERVVSDAELDELFATNPASFVAARNALAKKVEEAGEREQASQIHALRKPTMVVWLINQLAHRHRDEVAALKKAGKQLRETQLKGLGSTLLREANEAWRVAVTAALRQIRKIAGRSIDEPRIVSTLMGAVADPEHADLLVRGRLTEELEPPGVEGVLGELAKAPPAPRKGAMEQQGSEATPSTEGLGPEHERRREAARELRSRERETKKAKRRAESAERVAVQLERRAKAAADQAATARKAADEAARRAQQLTVELQRLR